MSRHQRNLFSRNALKRFAALGYVAGLSASVELVHLLRDFVAWEPSSLLRKRAAQILSRMERHLQDQFPNRPAGVAGCSEPATASVRSVLMTSVESTSC